MKPKNILLLAGEWDSTAIIYNYLRKFFLLSNVIIEQPVPRKEFLKRRIKKSGYIKVGGQVLFQLLISKPMNFFSKKRIDEILTINELDTTPIPQNNIIRFTSVNSQECLQTLKDLQPDLIVVHGTRIISKEILKNMTCPFVNMHAGITPRYRGSHGAYWALLNQDEGNCGVTIHLIDAGIDTGGILFQEKIKINKEDNFTTYPYLQLATGLNLLKMAITDLLFGNIKTIDNVQNSALWYHPTLWQYLYHRVRNGIK